MELVKTASRHQSWFSETIYVVLNLALAVAVLLLVRNFSDMPILAYILVLLSKWRVLAVRPRFWFANLQANVVDLLVGLSAVTLIWQSAGSLVVQIGLTVGYAAWLLALKPRSSRTWVLLQSGVAQFVAVTALLSLSYRWPSWLVVLIMWVIGYSVARHVLANYEEDDLTLLSLIWGLIVAELGWLAYHWTIAYALSNSNGVVSLQIPQMAIILAALGYIIGKCYSLYSTKSKPHFRDIGLQVGLSSALILALLVFFNGFSQ
jgi:hypothetical protein